MKFREVLSLKDVFRPKHDLAKMPKSACRKMFIRFLLHSVSAIVTQLFVFLLSGATTSIEKGYVILGIVLFIIYNLRTPISGLIGVISEYFSSKLDEILSVDLAERSMNAMLKVSGKVVHKGKYISKPVILTNLGKYIEKYRKTWQQAISLTINLLIFLVSIISMIGVAVKKFDNLWLFAITTIGAVISNFVIAYKKASVSNGFYEKVKNLVLRKEEQKNDCVNMKPVCREHSSFMLKK